METKSLKKEETQWSQLGVIVCTKCNTLFDTGELKSEQNCGENLKNILKSKIKQSGLMKECRVMTSSCQNLCEKNRQAVTLFENCKSAETYSLHPEQDLEQLYQLILSRIKI